MCLDESYRGVWVGKHLSDMFPIKSVLRRVDASSPLLFNLEYAIRRIQGNQDGLVVSGRYQLLVYADYVHMFGGSVHTTWKNTEALFVAGKETGLEVNVDKTKYMTMCEDQNAGRIIIPLKGWKSSNIWEQP
jgi:hypothetical protein